MSRGRSLLPTLSILSLAVTFGVVAVTPAFGSAWPRAHRVRNWEPEFMANDHSYSRAEALAHAREFDVIVAISGSFREHVGAMRQANPRLRILAYQNGGYSSTGRSYPEAWYAHTATGARIRSRDHGNYLMQIANPNYVRHVISECRDHLDASRYDGCFLDSMGPAAMSTSYVTGVAIDPRTGSAWGLGDYIRAGRHLVGEVGRATGRRLVVANGVASGSAYFASPGTGILADPIDGAMVELFVRTASDSPGTYRPTSRWRLDVDMLRHAARNDRTLFCVTKAWSDASRAREDRMFRYAFATFLLGASSRSYFSFLYDRNTGRPSSAWDVGLGRPRGAYGRHDGVFQRRFAHGRALVNPSDRGVRVRLPHRMRTLGGRWVRRVWMPDHTGLVLLRR